MTEGERNWATICHRATSLSPEDARKLEEVLLVTPEDIETRVELVGHWTMTEALETPARVMTKKGRAA